jgi:hypothetical protein
MSSRTLPPELADLYPMSGDWHRLFPWCYAPNRNDHYQTTFCRVTPSKDHVSTETKVTVAVPRSIFRNEQAALWDITNQLRRACNVPRSRDGKFCRERRRGRPGKRARERMRNEREGAAR